MELMKNNIHMNRQKGTAVSQITLDDDFIVPDTMDDVSAVLLGNGDIQIESSRAQGDRVLIRGKLSFAVLYRRESGGLQSLKGEIPFEETVNVPELEEKDSFQVSWNLEDLNTGMINSRKLNIKAVVMLEVRVESLYDAEAAVDVKTDDGRVEIQRRDIDKYSFRVLLIFCLAFYNLPYHFHIYFFDWFLLRYRDWRAALFSKCIMAASPSRRIHFISITFQYLSQFIKPKIF